MKPLEHRLEVEAPALASLERAPEWDWGRDVARQVATEAAARKTAPAGAKSSVFSWLGLLLAEELGLAGGSRRRKR